ncbi:MAG: hypothetical protein COA44_10175 [Arcobacter sp.]|nr:MAG: hypothetical protein COA44_10175 [Arcobacter sp.]
MKLFIIICFTLFLIGCGGGGSDDTPAQPDANNAQTNLPAETISINLLEAPLASSQIPLVVILVDFNDIKISQAQTSWSQQLFGIAQGQLNNYFLEVSQNTFSFSPALETGGDSNNDGIIQVDLGVNHPNPSPTFPDNGIGNFDTDIAIPALSIADANINFSAFDTNTNGIIEQNELQIMFITAGGEQATGLMPGIWAHQSCINGQNFDSVSIMQCGSGTYTVFGERHFYFDARGNYASIGIMAHELGHGAFLLPDLYDTDGSSEGIGGFGLMGSGSWGLKVNEDPGATPVHMSAWSKFQSGFLIKSDINISSNNILITETEQLGHQVLRINTQDTKEYFLIENRSKYGYDAGLFMLDHAVFNGGLAIWHIDESKTTNQNENNKLVDLEEADGFHLDTAGNQGNRTNLFYAGNISPTYTGVLTPISTPANTNLYNNTSTNISISNISSSGSIMHIDLHL